MPTQWRLGSRAVPDVTQTDHGGAVSEPFFQREKQPGNTEASSPACQGMLDAVGGSEGVVI